MKIETISTDGLIPYARNARTHSSEQINQIAASIQKFGFTNPILIDNNNMVIADNKIALNAGWNEELLQIELGELKDLGVDLESLGCDMESFPEFENMFEISKGNTDKDDEVPEPPTEQITKRGDIWQLGKHRLMCGDSTMIDDVKCLMNGQIANMVFTDPPYNVNYGATMKDKLRYHTAPNSGRTIMNDNLGDDFEQFLYDACTNMMMYTAGDVYICMSSSELHTLYNAATKAGAKWSTFIIWAKNTFTLGRANYQRQYEPIFYGWVDGKPHHWCGDRNQADVWEYNKPTKNDLHPTMKPVELVERAINNSSKIGDGVFDPFGGSGTTLIACQNTGRTAYLMELDPKFCDVIIKRWEEKTGQKAVLLSNAE